MQQVAKSKGKRTGKDRACAAVVLFGAGVAELGFRGSISRGKLRASEEVVGDGIGESKREQGRKSKEKDGMHDVKIGL